MAKRRMFNTDVVNTDDFRSMPRDTQLLYFYLGLSADDDGFVSWPKIVLRILGIRQNHLNLLAEKGYIRLFDSGVCLICDWQAHNYIRRDRYTPTRCQKEKESLGISSQDGQPTVIPDDIPNDNHADNHADSSPVDTGKVRSGKDRSGKDRSDEETVCAAKPPRPRFSPPGVEEVAAYCTERKNSVDPQRFVDFYTANGWVQNRNKPIKDWRAAVRLWERRDKNGRDDPGDGYYDTPIEGVCRF